MFKNLVIFVAVICSYYNVHSQNVFDPTDPIVTYNPASPPGSPTNPNAAPYFAMTKWVRTSRISTWNTSSFKCYVWNGMNFRMRFPNNYNPANAGKYPVIVFFHGGGEVGSVYDNENQLAWGAQLFEQRINNNGWNGFLIFPQEPVTGWNDYQFSRINSVLDTLQKYNNSDPDRVITMGLSAGGYGAAAYASAYPRRIATALPASAIQAVSLISNVNDWVHIPVWFANGGADINPDPASAQNFYTGFRNAGGNIYQSYFVNDGHGTWVDMWNMKNAAGAYIADVYWNSAHKAQPLVYYQNQQFCASGAIAARMGITAGFTAYEWQRNGITIAGATSNEYTATQTGTYRVRFMRAAGGAWSAWTPNPVLISTKICTMDTLFAEHFTNDRPYLSALVYSNANFPCQNGIITSGTDLFTQDASGVQGRRFLINFTNAGASCVYASNAVVWSTATRISVSPNTNYEFSFYAGSQNIVKPAKLVPTVNGRALTTAFTVIKNTGSPSWKKYTYTWNSGLAISVSLGIINQLADTAGNDFAVDEISFKRSSRISLPVQRIVH